MWGLVFINGGPQRWPRQILKMQEIFIVQFGENLNLIILLILMRYKKGSRY